MPPKLIVTPPSGENTPKSTSQSPTNVDNPDQPIYGATGGLEFISEDAKSANELTDDEDEDCDKNLMYSTAWTEEFISKSTPFETNVPLTIELLEKLEKDPLGNNTGKDTKALRRKFERIKIQISSLAQRVRWLLRGLGNR